MRLTCFNRQIFAFACQVSIIAHRKYSPNLLPSYVSTVEAIKRVAEGAGSIDSGGDSQVTETFQMLDVAVVELKVEPENGYVVIHRLGPQALLLISPCSNVHVTQFSSYQKLEFIQ